MAAHFFCPGCWREIGKSERRCPDCGYVLEDFQGLPYEGKLIRALDHPVRENRMMAIRILGDLKAQAALPAFEKVLERETDYYVIREVVVALHKIGTTAAIRRIESLRGHPSTMVRKLVKMVLCGVQPK
ncbi:MAG: HEAT repeat domain-containing protein [Syntrophales bacterium]|jgi:HEAT repeat protein|nr:HEAT repeat domain-containing protein [Syntrophales bacterium]